MWFYVQIIFLRNFVQPVQSSWDCTLWGLMDGQPWARQVAQRSKSSHTRHLKRRPCTRPPQRSPRWKIRPKLQIQRSQENWWRLPCCSKIQSLGRHVKPFVQRNFSFTNMKSMQGEQYIINISFLLASSRDLILLIHDAVAFSQTFVSTSCGDQSDRYKF